MKLPSVPECNYLFQQYHVPENIFKHCQQVSALSFAIAKKLERKGVLIDVELVKIGALLHDWMKAVTFEKLEASEKFSYTPTQEDINAWKSLKERFSGKHETQVAYELLKDIYPELANFLLREGKLYDDGSVQSWEEKVVHYADWRILGVNLVPLDDRLKDFSRRYTHQLNRDPEKWKRMKESIQHIEQELCQTLQVGPEELH